jgi:hypothetical protein
LNLGNVKNAINVLILCNLILHKMSGSAMAKLSGSEAVAIANSEDEMKRLADEAEAEFEAAMAEDEDDEDQHGGGIGGLLSRANEAIKEQAREFTRAFVDYGPPYYPHEETFGLINECSEQKGKVFEVHSLLNAKVDPNLRDHEDLFYTAGHWSARNCHLMIMRMLRRAGGNFELLNEFGQTCLHMACLIKQPKDRLHAQAKLVKYLLNECECDPNVRDKGGFCPLDYAAQNDAFLVIEALLRGGADLLRNNEMLVAKRRHILDGVEDPECYRILTLALRREEAKFEIINKERQAKKEAEAHKKKMARRQEESIQKKMTEWKEKQETAAKAYQKKVKREREDRLHAEMNNLSDGPGKKRTGAYVRHPTTGKWTWAEKHYEKTTAKVYKAAREHMKDMRDLNKREIFNDRWKELTGGELEMEWTKSKAFDIEGLSDEEKIADIEEEKSEYDENDEELQDMDLDDVLF